jgi:hypothetical protein
MHLPRAGQVQRMTDFDVLPTFALLARFVVDGGTAEEATAHVERRLSAVPLPFDQVELERREDDGTWMVVARFVEPSLDSHTATAGLHDTLTAAGLIPDEVWVDSAP